jgi:hypothetical protein
MNSPVTPPRHLTLPIIQHLIAAYRLWHEFLPHLPKDARYTLGAKIDALLIDAIELIFSATYLSREQKLPYLQKATAKLDTAKFFLQILWEVKALDNKKYAALSEKLNEIGRMLGGWMRQTISRD